MSVKNQWVELDVINSSFHLDGDQLRQLVYEGGKTLRSVTLHWQGVFSRQDDQWMLELPDGLKLPIQLAGDLKPIAGTTTPITLHVKIPDDPTPVNGPYVVESLTAQESE